MNVHEIKTEKIIMKGFSIIPHNVIEKVNLQELKVESFPADGDPVEINGELYFVCGQEFKYENEIPVVGVIPLVVRNPAKVENIRSYIECLSIAHKNIQFKNANGICTLDNCEEMIIS
jgi:hypothetical protein